jgi:hypothetical protein
MLSRGLFSALLCSLVTPILLFSFRRQRRATPPPASAGARRSEDGTFITEAILRGKKGWTRMIAPALRFKIIKSPEKIRYPAGYLIRAT